MNSKHYWGIAALIVFVIAAGGFIYWQLSEIQDVERQQVETLAETEKFKKWWKEHNAPPKNDSAEGSMPDETTDTGKRVDAGVSAEKSEDVQEADKFPDWDSLTPEQKQHIADQFYVQFGLEPPPDGYDYHWKDAGVPYLDENGKPVLRRLDEPIVEIEMGIGFAPTLEEFERWEKLYDDQGWAEARGDVDEAKRLKAEMDALEASVQRMRPLTVSAYGSTAEAKSKSDRFATEKMCAALREHGLAHLISHEAWD